MAFKKMIPVAYIIVFLLGINDAEAAIGMNWGRQTAQRLVPSQVVDLLLQNGIGQARVYTSEEDILQAFAGSGINLTVTIYNATRFSSMEEARTWVGKRSPYFSPCNIRAVYLGGYVFFDGLRNKAYINSAIKSLQNLQNALNEAGYGDQIKATFLHIQSGVLKNITRPSEAEFLDEIKEEIITTVRFLQENNAPFAIEMFPIADIEYGRFDFSFAFPNTSTQVIRDINDAIYTNVIEFVFDSFVWALDKINASNMKIILAQVGWPTDGYPRATTANAERFYKSLLPWVASNKGTPMRPREPLDLYVHALTDENQMPYSYPFTRHWGIYRSNGEPKFKIDLSGQGRDTYPPSVRGIMRMPGRWCLFNRNSTDLGKVMNQFNLACKIADCTCLAPGGSCSKLSFDQNISYAFNMYFQFKFQDETACDFEGLGNVVMDDPSTDECLFPVEVVKGRQNNLVLPHGNGFQERPNYAIFVFLLSILGALFWD